MQTNHLINEIISAYQKHGWELKTVLLRPETVGELQDKSYAGNERVQYADVDAIWFSRPSHRRGEAWELRLLSETPYALFHQFEADQPDEQRVQVLKDMEGRMHDYIKGA